MKTLYVDGNNLIARVAFAAEKNPLEGGHPRRPVEAVLLFLKTLRKTCETYRPDQIVIVWDEKRSQWRMNQLISYKAQRDTTLEPLVRARKQTPEIREVSEWLGIANVSHPDLEADDIIAWLAHIEPKENEVLIMSNDNDLAQIIAWRENATVIKKEKETNIRNFRDTFGIPPEQFLKWKALQGDTSDNIPGIPKVGPATATKIVDGNKSHETILEELGKREKKYTEKNKIELATWNSFARRYEQNLRLMNLRTWELDNGPADMTVWMQITAMARQKPTIRIEQFTDHCKFNGLPSIGNQMPEWATPFPGCLTGVPNLLI